MPFFLNSPFGLFLFLSFFSAVGGTVAGRGAYSLLIKRREPLRNVILMVFGLFFMTIPLTLAARFASPSISLAAVGVGTATGIVTALTGGIGR